MKPVASRRRDSEDSDNLEAEIWYCKAEPAAQNSEAWVQPLHTEPVLQLTRKFKRIHGTTTSKLSPNTSHCMEAVISMVWKICLRQLGDLMKDLNVNVSIWGTFMNATLQAAVHLGKDYNTNLHDAKNHLWDNCSMKQKD